MKTTNYFLFFVLVIKIIYSKVIDSIANQLNVEDDSVEIINSNNFIYKLHCSDEEELCDKIKNDFDYAFNILSNAFEFYQPVVFEAFVENLGLKYGIYDFSAGVTDINYISLKTSNDSEPSLYPQALSKQLNLNQELDYKKNDFIMEINNFNIIQRELRSIFIHEILHGLGFAFETSIGKLDDNDVYRTDDKQNELSSFEEDYTILPFTIALFNEKKLQEITNIDEYNNQLNNTETTKFLPQFIFDKYLVSIETGEKILTDLEFYYKELNQKCLPKDGSPLLLKNRSNKYMKECFETLNPETQDTIKHIINDYFFKSNSVGFLTKDGDIVPLQTTEYSFSPGSSITHPSNPLLDLYIKLLMNNDPSFYDLINTSPSGGIFNRESIIKYYDDNYILYYMVGDDFTLEEMLELLPNNKKHPLIGDGIVNVLKTLGWTEKGEKREEDIYYVDETIQIPEINEFKYMNMRKYEVENQDNHNTETNGVVEEPTLTLPDDFDLDLQEVDEDVVLSPNQESDSDSDVEEKQ